MISRGLGDTIDINEDEDLREKDGKKRTKMNALSGCVITTVEIIINKFSSNHPGWDPAVPISILYY